MDPSGAPTEVAHGNNLRLLVGILIGTVLGAGVTAGCALYLFGTYKSGVAMVSSIEKPLKAQAGGGNGLDLRTYENKEMGIAFEYPENWGAIFPDSSVEDCFSNDANYYTAVQLAAMKKDMAGSDDPCTTVIFKAPRGMFMVTMTPMAAKYPIPRGGFWGFNSGKATSDAYIANYCASVTDAKCALVTNPHGVRFVHYSDGYIGLEEKGEFYLAHTPHPLYYGLSLSPSRLPADMQDGFKQIIESLRFI